jgi:hypothetical protein
MALRLTMGFSDNPRVQPLKDGIVKPQGIELDCITLDPSNLFQRNLTYDEFDVSEMSISETLLARERTDGKKWDWSALPVFLSRGHHWHTLYVNAASGIKSLADLRGKRIGVPDYDMTAALWFRITLKDLHGIEAKDNVWYNGRTKELSHGGALGLATDGPVGVTHHWLTVDQTLDVMLDRGEIDACTAIRPEGRVTAGDTTVVDRWGGTPIDGKPSPQEAAGRQRQGGRLRVLSKDRMFPGESSRDRAEPHSPGTSVGRAGAVQGLSAIEGSGLRARPAIPVGVPVLSGQRLSGAGGGLRRRSVSHRSPCHG